MELLRTLLLAILFAGINAKPSGRAGLYRRSTSDHGHGYHSDEDLNYYDNDDDENSRHLAQRDLPYAPLIWSGVVEKGGEEMTFSGTLDDVEKQIRAIKPGFTWASLRQELAENIQHQGNDDKEGPAKCNEGGRMKKDLAQSAADYLHGVPGMCSVPGGVCATLTCDWGRGVDMCNENPASLVSEYDRWINRTCSEVGDHVQDLIAGCAFEPFPAVSDEDDVRGRQDYAGNYYVQTKLDECGVTLPDPPSR